MMRENETGQPAYNIDVRVGSRASFSALDASLSISAMPRWRPRSSGGAICRDGPEDDMSPCVICVEICLRAEPSPEGSQRRLILGFTAYFSLYVPV